MAQPADDSLTLLAFEVDDVLTFAETCTPPVAQATPCAVEAPLAELDG